MKILIFGTVYCKDEESQNLARQWGEVHTALNPTCGFLLVDSNSPMPVSGVPVLQLGDNIGHLGRNGRDGWGRAFCAGLQYAVDHGADYVVHIEGDSLLRRPVRPFCEFMHQNWLSTFVVGVDGTKFKEFEWVETGLMFMSVPYICDSNFIERYNWQDGASKKYPNTPEAVIYQMLDQDRAINVAPIRVVRDDRNVLTKENVRGYDWITHTSPEIFATFVSNLMVPT